MAPPILSLRELTKNYGAQTVVDAVTLDVEEGQFLTLLGPSGSGKTSLLMMIAGFVEPSSGAIISSGHEITNTAPEKRNFGMVFQGYALFPHLTVARNVEFPLAVRGRPAAERGAKVKSALELVHLAHLGGRRPQALSGGQQQRVALARALVFSPDLLLLDEPLSALDKQLRAELQTELRQLHKQVGMTFICVTHDQEEALSMADEIAVIRNGRMIQKGPPRELYERPVSHFVAAFLGESNFLDGKVIALAREEAIYRVGGLEFRQAISRPLKPGEPILTALRPNKIKLSREEPAENPNRVAGRIVDMTYRGGVTILSVRTALGDLRAEQRSENFQDLLPHEPTWMCWAPDAATVVADDREHREGWAGE